MAAVDHLLITTDELSRYLEAAPSALMGEIAAAVSVWAEQATNRQLAYRTVANLWLPGPASCRLFPKLVPIDLTQTISIEVDGTVQTVWTGATGRPEDFDVAVLETDPGNEVSGPDQLYRGQGWASPTSRFGPNVKLSYSGGYKPQDVPPDLKEALGLIAQKMHREHKARAADVVTITRPGGAISVLDVEVPRRAASTIHRYRYYPIAAA